MAAEVIKDVVIDALDKKTTLRINVSRRPKGLFVSAGPLDGKDELKVEGLVATVPLTRLEHTEEKTAQSILVDGDDTDASQFIGQVLSEKLQSPVYTSIKTTGFGYDGDPKVAAEIRSVIIQTALGLDN